MRTVQIDLGVFGNCLMLDDVYWPDSLHTISDYAFFSCKNLRKIHLPNNLTKIGEKAFCFCENLAGLELPSSLAFIENYAFYNCSKLEYVLFDDNRCKLGKNVFDGCHQLKNHADILANNQPLENKEDKAATPNSCNNEYEITAEVQVKNSKGVHARPASLMAKLAHKYTSVISIKAKDSAANCRSPIGLLHSHIKYGDYIEIHAVGNDAHEAVADIVKLVSEGFGES